MYQPAHFREERIDVVHTLIKTNPLGILVTLTPGGLEANHIPFEIDPDPAPFGTLRSHVARGNPVWNTAARDLDALVVFQGPQAYVSPSWYETKRENGKVVPTYNYLVAHAYGPLRAIEDAAWLRTFVERLTNRFESGRADPWQVGDAPADFIDKQIRAIVGIEIPVARLLGKWKASQNRPPVDREGVARGLDEQGGEDARAMAAWVRAAKD